MKKRPVYSDDLYSALHGPTATNSTILYETSRVGKKWQRKIEPNEMWDQWKNLYVLYLFHGDRWCVMGEKETKSDDLLFDKTENALNKAYPFQNDIYKNSKDVYVCARDCARSAIEDNDIKDIVWTDRHPQILYARDAIAAANNQSTSAATHSVRYNVPQPQYPGLRELLGRSTKRPRLNKE